MTTAPDLVIVFAAVFLPFAAIPAIPFVYRTVGDRTGYVGAAVAVACFGLLTTQYGREGAVGVAWIPQLNIRLQFYIDAWALMFALLASGIGVLIFTYSVGYMHGESSLPRYYAALLAFMGSILGIALAADLIALFLFWEITSVCSFILIGHYDSDPESRYAARMAMFVTIGGGLLLLIGIILLRQTAAGVVGTATFDLVTMLENSGAIQAGLRESGLFVVVLVCFAIGAGAKSAQVPLHFWLPNAMAAPTPVSAFLHSATMVKVGVYFVGRIRPLFASPEWLFLFATLGLATMLITAMLAVAATDTKELLAYSTASHLGLMIAGFGFTSMYGAAAGVFHLLNHAAFKAALFLVAGIVAHEAGSRQLADLNGLRHDLPVTAAITAVAAFGMAGIPPFNGFYSKELFFEATYHAGHELGGLAWLYPAVAVIASVFTVLYSLRFLAIFLGDRPSTLGTIHRPSLTLLVPTGILAVVVAALSIHPQFAVPRGVAAAMTATGGNPDAVHIGLPTDLSPAFMMTIIAILGGIGLYPVYGRLHQAIRDGLGVVPPVRATWWYDGAVSGLDRIGTTVIPHIQNGLLRTYVSWLVGIAAALTLLGYLAGRIPFPPLAVFTQPTALIVVLLVGALAATAITTDPSQVVGVLLLSVLGFMIAIFYILASAPDLALTQLVVETLTLVIFLLVIEELPAYYGEMDPPVVARDILLSLLVGATIFVTVLVSLGGPDSALARYFTEQAVPQGGGTNIVNVILVDFRSFDTLGESTVIVIAAIAVLTVVLMRDQGESS